MLICRYPPNETDTTPTRKVALECGGALESAGPATLVVDSRYDLDGRQLHTRSTSWENRNGLIRTHANDEWHLDIALHVAGQKVRTVVSLIIIAVAFAAPGLVAKIAVTVAVGLLSGLLAGAAMLFGIQRVPP